MYAKIKVRGCTNGFQYPIAEIPCEKSSVQIGIFSIAGNFQAASVWSCRTEGILGRSSENAAVIEKREEEGTSSQETDQSVKPMGTEHIEKPPKLEAMNGDATQAISGTGASGDDEQQDARSTVNAGLEKSQSALDNEKGKNVFSEKQVAIIPYKGKTAHQNHGGLSKGRSMVVRRLCENIS
ncbi:hypothetical protein PanWU01x14_217590 [Parasponia andersonii]|uniref:Uncharacterized protein n=1 Tax=Parasponia andersonii TaxID=3476 RepID=A0A2P5BR95_PARAD|nr:hypothetical protein PanWU01x14_217590 [Parasponia andersonii]